MRQWGLKALIFRVVTVVYLSSQTSCLTRVSRDPTSSISQLRDGADKLLALNLLIWCASLNASDNDRTQLKKTEFMVRN